jgi:hypothetical protein
MARKKRKRSSTVQEHEIDKLRIPPDLSKDWVAETAAIAERLPAPKLVDPARPKDDLAAMIGEDVILTATTGPDPSEVIHEVVTPAESGGPYVETDAGAEFAFDTDESNPPDAEPAPLPDVTPKPDSIPE